jgi:transposase
VSRPCQEPNAENGTIGELKESGRVGSIETSTRCMAIQMLLAGADRELVCNALAVTERSVRKWIRLFNERGVDGLIVKKRPGRTAILSGRSEELVELIEEPARAERTFWTAKAFHGYISESCQLELSYATVVRFFHNQGYKLKVPQPWPDRQDEAQREVFKKEVAALLDDPEVDLWFADESGFEGDPRPRRRWDKKGRKTRTTKNGNHLRMNAIGMVCPRTGEFFAIEASHSDSYTFQAFLDQAEQFITFKRPKNILILDNASWHRKKSNNWHGWKPKFLPPYSPDLNPIERIWLIMKANYFNNYICKSVDQLIQRLDEALLNIINNPDNVKSTANIGTLF